MKTTVGISYIAVAMRFLVPVFGVHVCAFLLSTYPDHGALLSPTSVSNAKLLHKVVPLVSPPSAGKRASSCWFMLLLILSVV